MPLLVTELHSHLNRIMRQKGIRLIPPEERDEALNYASRLLFTSNTAMVNKTRSIPSYLRPFIKKTSLSFAFGVASLPIDFNSVVALTTLKDGREWDASIVSSPDDFHSANLAKLAKNTTDTSFIPERYHAKKTYIDTDFTNRIANLPDTFLSARGGLYTDVNGLVTNILYADTPSVWNSRSVEALKDRIPPEEYRYYVKEVVYDGASFTLNKVNLPTDFVKVERIDSIHEGKTYEGVFLNTEEFSSRKISDINKLEETLNVNKVQYNAHQANNLGYIPLPSDYIKVDNVYVVDSCGDYIECVLLSEAEWGDRISSYIVSPDPRFPVAKIINDKLYVTDGTSKSLDIALVYFTRPNPKRITATVIGNELYVEGLDSVTRVKLTYTRDPYKFRIDGGLIEVNFTVNPTETFTFDYLGYPTEYAPVVMSLGNSLEIKPSAITSGSMYYLANPTKCVFNYSIAGDGRNYVYNPIGSIDLEWGVEAFPEIISFALAYLGISITDNDLAGLSLSTVGTKSMLSQGKEMDLINQPVKAKKQQTENGNS